MDTIDLSSGEAELGALVKACSEGLGIQALLQDLNFTVTLKVLSDATAAIGMTRRLGLGRVRHLAVGDLWVQQGLRQNRFALAKYPTNVNGADLMTKGKSRLDTLRLVGLIGFVTLPGRPGTAPLRASKWDISKPVAPPRVVGNDLIDTGMCEVGYDSDDGIDACRSGILHHMELSSYLVEGRNLHAGRAFPSKSNRILYSI